MDDLLGLKSVLFEPLDSGKMYLQILITELSCFFPGF